MRLNLPANLKVHYDIISIEKPFSSFEEELAPLFKGKEQGCNRRKYPGTGKSTILMAVSNKFGSILLNTSNKSEAAVGYGTLYGDMAGGLSVIGDVYKTDIYGLQNI